MIVYRVTLTKLKNKYLEQIKDYKKAFCESGLDRVGDIALSSRIHELENVVDDLTRILDRQDERQVDFNP